MVTFCSTEQFDDKTTNRHTNHWIRWAKELIRIYQHTSSQQASCLENTVLGHNVKQNEKGFCSCVCERESLTLFNSLFLALDVPHYSFLIVG